MTTLTSGSPGETICELAQSVPVLRIVHGGVGDAVDAVTESAPRS